MDVVYQFRGSTDFPFANVLAMKISFLFFFGVAVAAAAIARLAPFLRIVHYYYHTSMDRSSVGEIPIGLKSVFIVAS
jgi:type IV secretory pathway component VirB8